MVKKLLAVILSLCIACSVLPIALAEDSLDLLVASDTHYQCAADLSALSGAEAEPFTDGLSSTERELFYHATSQGQMNHESRAILKSLLRSFAQSEEEILLLSGDLTCGKRNSHLELAQLLAEFEAQSGKRIFVINGNHDCRTDRLDTYIDVNEFKQIYADFGYNEALRVHESSASYVVDLSAGVRLLSIDSNIYGEDKGEINPAVMSFVRAELEAAKIDGKQVIAMMHHSLLPHYELQPMIDSYQAFAEYLADNGVALMLTGHIHANDISSASSKKGNSIYDVLTGSLISAPNAYRRLSLGRSSCRIETKYITDIDIQDLTADYTAEQLNLLENNFTEYAYGFFEAGVCKWLNRYLGSAYKISRLLKVEEGTAAYELLESVMENIKNSLHMDIYSNGTCQSIEDIARQSNVSLPPSSYQKPYQVAARLMYAFFCGDEAELCNEEDSELLLCCLKAVVANSIYSAAESSRLSALLSLLYGERYLGLQLSDTAKLIFMNGAVSLITTAAFDTLTKGITEDYCFPADRAVELDLSAGAIRDGSPLSMLIRFIRIIINFLKKLFNTFGGF